MKIYLASRYVDKPIMRDLRDQLVELGYVVTSRWLDGHDQSSDGTASRTAELNQQFAEEDEEDILAADVLILFNPLSVHGTGKGGRHVETGMALSVGMPVFLWGVRENVFHFNRHVKAYEHLPELLDALAALTRVWVELSSDQ